MNKIILSLALCLTALSPTRAADDLTIADFLAMPGTTDKELAISLNNDQPYAAFQFDLVLPEGVTVTSFSATERLAQKTDVQMHQQPNGSYRFIAIPTDLTTNITGTSGTIITITVSVANNAALGTLTGYFHNIKLSNTSGEGPTYNEISFPINIYKRGDVNNDGDIDIADAVCIVNHVVGKPTPSFNDKAADVNDDGDIDIADAVRIVNFVVGKIDALARRYEVEWNLPEPE